MTRTTKRLMIGALCFALFAGEAMAWGPRAQKAISMGAVQLIRREFSSAFKARESNYETDLLRGAEDGIDALAESVPINTDAQAVAAVMHEIELLRAARDYGEGSYFAYRMGVLSALVSEVVLPYGIPFSEEHRAVKAKVDADLDRHLDEYSFAPKGNSYVYLRTVDQYFKEKRVFYPDDLILIADDYERGKRYRGFLSEAGQTYFSRAIESVVDAWYTVLLPRGPVGVPPSPRILTWYFVDEIGYLLNIGKNLQQANRVYGVFEKVNPGMMDPFEKIGDYYFSFGSMEARERGVREWKIAQRNAGPQRRRASKKLARHYIEKGQRFFRKSEGPESGDTDLESALRAFQSALEFDRTNELAADRINDTTVAINERSVRYEMQRGFVDNALIVSVHAEKSRLEERYKDAFGDYNSALDVLAMVGPEFKDLSATATENIDQIGKSIKAITREVLARARQHMDDGDDALMGNRFAQAVGSYEMVAPTVKDIPAREGTSNAQRKQDLIDEALGRIGDAKVAEQRYQQNQQGQPPVAGAPGLGAKAAGAGPGAGSASPGPGRAGPGRAGPPRMGPSR